MTDYLTIAEAAALCREAPETLRRKMRSGVLQAGIHFVRPRGSRPLIKRAAFLAWVAKRALPRHYHPQQAHALVSRAIKRGDLVRPAECSACGSTVRIHGHHEDYARPLDVVWLCKSCHGRRHTKERVNWAAVL